MFDLYFDVIPLIQEYYAMKTRTKVTGALIVLLAVCGILGTLLLVSTQKISSLHHSVSQGMTMKGDFLSRIIDHLNWDRQLSDIVYHNAAAEIQTDHTKCKLGKWYYGFINSNAFRMLPADIQEKLRSIDRPHEELHRSAGTIVGLIKNGNLHEAEAVYVGVTQKYLAQVKKIIFDINGMIDRENAGLGQRSTSYTESINLLVTVAVAVGIVVGLFVLFLTFKALGVLELLKPFNSYFTKAAFGDLTVRYPLESVNCSKMMNCGKKSCPDFGKDSVMCWFDVGSYAPQFGKEIHCPKILSKEYSSCAVCKVYKMVNRNEVLTLAAWYNKFIDNLHEMVGYVVTGAQNLGQAVEQISAGNQNLSQRTSEQASSLEEIAATIEQATVTVKNTGSNAAEANTLANETSRLAAESGGLVDTAVQSINQISESSKKIGEIITVINDIAFQTNLLALNAAVEAARAGDMGRGFAVVAGEVRNLAQRSGTAAKEISNLIEDTQQKVENGTIFVNRSGEALKEIILSVTKVGSMIHEIAASSDEQNRGMDQINIAVADLDQMTQQNASLVEETASASEEMSNQAKELIEKTDKFTIHSGDEIAYHGLSQGTEISRKRNGNGNGNGNGKVMGMAPKESHRPAGIAANTIHPAHTNGQGTRKIMENEGFEEF